MLPFGWYSPKIYQHGRHLTLQQGEGGAIQSQQPRIRREELFRGYVSYPITSIRADSSIVLGYQRKDYQGVIKALAEGSMQPEKMITGKIHIDRVVEDGFTPLINVSSL